MTGDLAYHSKTENQQQQAAGAAGDDSLLHHSGFLDRMKQGASQAAGTIGHKAGDWWHKGLEEGKKLADKPAAKQIQREVTQAGKEIARQHVDSVNGVIQAGKHGDVAGAIRKGLALAGEAMMGPGALALKIAKDKGADIAISHAPKGQQEKLREMKGAVDRATDRTHLPQLTITGIAKEAARSASQRASAQDSARSASQSASAQDSAQNGSTERSEPSEHRRN